MPAVGRRGHRKSKTGCYQCKARKVKCDETKPMCNNCTRHLQPGPQQCVYNSVLVTTVQSSSEPPQNAPHPSTPAPVTNFLSKSRTASPSTALSPTLRNNSLTIPDSLVTSVPSPHLELRVNQLHMRLLHTYSTSTSITLARNPVLQNLWRVHVPELAFASDYVMHSVLSLASLHIAFCHPETKDQYLNYALQLHEAALRTATGILTNVTDDNSPALYTFAALSFFISWAMPPKPDVLWFMGDGLGSNGMVIFRGTRTIIESTKERPSVLSSRIGPLFSIGRRRRQARDSKALQNHEPLVALQAILVESVSDPGTLRIYTAAIEQLSRCFTMVQDVAVIHGGFAETSDVFGWLFAVSDEYLNLLSQRTQESLVIFGHFCVLLKNLEWAWWVSGWSLRQVSLIYHDMLDFEHQAWLQWPMEQLGWIPA